MKDHKAERKRRVAAIVDRAPLGLVALAVVALSVVPAMAGGEGEVAAFDQTVQPRLTLHIPSMHKLLSEAHRSRAGVFGDHLAEILLQTASQPVGDVSEGIDPEEAAALLAQVKEWPDSAVTAALFAPDREGRARWTIAIDWPVDDLYERLKTLHDSDAAESMFADIALNPGEQGEFEITLPGSPLTYLRSGETGSFLTSHRELSPPAIVPRQTGEGEEESTEVAPPLLTCRLQLTGTETDSGATFFSKFSTLTGADYEARVDEAGDWIETARVHWPPIVGTGVKMFMGRIKRTFFVPDDAFGALTASTMMAPAMLESIAGFGPQVGPIARHMGPALCVTILPGTGFFPMPDIVIQARAKGAEKFDGDVRKAIEKINETFRDREQAEPWHETTVRGKTVFWREGGGAYPGAVMPLLLHPVVFLTKETDAKGRERDFVVLAWTSTNPERLVRRWLDVPRHKEPRYLPTKNKTNGQLWVHWKQLYRWVHPYLNLSLSSAGIETLLPYADEVGDRLTDGLVTAKTGYTGLTVSHNGPVPVGTLVLPAFLAAATGIDESGGSDLARERLASRRLLVLYHHSKLFKKDHGRWPAEVAELDGYVDFAGNAGLLKLELSSRQKWGELFKGIFDDDDEEEKDEEDEEEDVTSDIDDRLYVIDWGRESWRLGYTPGTLLHVENLFIDQDGKIHRVEKTAVESSEDDSEDQARANSDGNASSTILEKAAENLKNRYGKPSGQKKKKE